MLMMCLTFAHYRVGMITLTEGPLSKFCKDGKYSDLFLMALRQYGMLCIGLYRSALTECNTLEFVAFNNKSAHTESSISQVFFFGHKIQSRMLGMNLYAVHCRCRQITSPITLWRHKRSSDHTCWRMPKQRQFVIVCDQSVLIIR